jgi:hypothetical protein
MTLEALLSSPIYLVLAPAGAFAAAWLIVISGRKQ